MTEYIDKFQELAVPWLLSNGVKILIIIIAALVIRKALNIVIDKIVRKMVTTKGFLSPAAEKKREDTLIRVFEGATGILILVVAVMMILSEIGLNVGPILAAAGVAGIAFGFGGQYVIRDVITGLFIILENQYRVGDVVSVGDKTGLVEDITLRSTVLRDLDGTVHHVPNGEITSASNMTKFYSRINLDIGVSYDDNLEKVIEVINKVGNEMAEDEKYKSSIKKAPQFLRVNDFADSSVVIKILGEVEPLKQWEIAGELRKRLKIAFDKEGIEIPFPQRVIHQK